MVKYPGLSISLMRWMVLAACVCGLSAHLFIDCLGLSLSLESAGPAPVQPTFAGLVEGDAHHDHFYLPVWQPAVLPANKAVLAPFQTVLRCLRCPSPLLPPPRSSTAF